MIKLGFVSKKRSDIDMTEGSIWRHILRFAFPLLLGNIFQQLYNTVDTWVVGNYVSDTAFSAVGTVGPIINTLIGFFLGLSSGAGVVISQFYGAKKYDKVSETVHTAILMTLILGVLFTGVGILMIPTMLGFIKMPEVVIPEATTYLTIYFSGIIGLMVYNIGAGILRAVGDSKRPFYFLVVSACINTVLDLLFVLVFKIGVAGVAYATIIAQGISALLVVAVLVKNDSCVRLAFKKLKIHGESLSKIFRVGIPAALQNAITSFSNVFVQSYINYFGDACMGGWTAYNKIDQLMFLPVQSISLASMTFVGQNLGKGQVARAKKGVTTALLMALSSMCLLMIPVIVFAPSLVAFFSKSTEIIAYGTQFLQTITPFYVFFCVNQIYPAALRGSGNSRAPMVIMLLSFVLFRQCYMYVVSNYIANTVFLISMGYPAGWILCAAITFVYYMKTDLSKGRLIDDAPSEEKSDAKA